MDRFMSILERAALGAVIRRSHMKPRLDKQKKLREAQLLLSILAILNGQTILILSIKTNFPK